MGREVGRFEVLWGSDGDNSKESNSLIPHTCAGPLWLPGKWSLRPSLLSVNIKEHSCTNTWGKEGTAAGEGRGKQQSLSQPHRGLWSLEDQRCPELGEGTGPLEPTLTIHWPWGYLGKGVTQGRGWCSCFWKLGNECLGLKRGSGWCTPAFPTGGLLEG